MQKSFQGYLQFHVNGLSLQRVVKRTCYNHALVYSVIVRFRAIDPQDEKGNDEQQSEEDSKTLDENPVSPPDGASIIFVRLTRGT